MKEFALYHSPGLTGMGSRKIGPSMTKCGIRHFRRKGRRWRQVAKKEASMFAAGELRRALWGLRRLQWPKLCRVKVGG